MTRFILLCLFGLSICEAKPLEIQIDSPHAIIMDAKTGRVLYEKNAREQIYPASTTKLATLLEVVRRDDINLNAPVVCSPEALAMTSEQEKIEKNFSLPEYWLEPDGIMVFLMPDEVLSLGDLLKAAMARSANDAANAAAAYVGGDIPSFMKDLNQTLKGLGCTQTHFNNPHGLHHPDHVSTAYDMALIMKEGLKYPIFRDYIQLKEFNKPKTNKQAPKEFKATSKMTIEGSKYYYPKALGAKTGYHRAGKTNIVAVASDGTRELIGVIHKAEEFAQRHQDLVKMFEVAFSEKKSSRLLFKSGDNLFQKTIKNGNMPLVATIDRDIIYESYPSEEEDIKAEIQWLDVELPVERGVPVAELLIKNSDDEVIQKELMISQNQVIVQKFYQRHPYLLIFLLIVSLGFFLHLTIRPLAK